MFLSDIDGPRWALMGLVVKLAHSVSIRPYRTACTLVANDIWISVVYVRRHPTLLTPQRWLITLTDRDSGKWNLGLEETYRRRSLFWEIYTYDSWQVQWFGSYFVIILCLPHLLRRVSHTGVRRRSRYST